MSSENILSQHLDEAASYIQGIIGPRTFSLGLVLGSGLNPLADSIEDPIVIPFGDVPHMQVSTAEGHKGQFVCGTLSGKSVLAMQGRLHAYEGYSSTQVAFPIWLMQRLGVPAMCTTNAAGGINEQYRPGDFCVMRDHINLTGRNPIANPDAAALAERFFSMTDCYDPALRATALRVAEERGIRAHEGVYLGLLGPSFETPAEIRAFRVLGADTVAMSVVEEVIAARHVGMRVLGISLVSNMAAGIGAVDGAGGASPSGEEVMVLAKTREKQFELLIRGIVETL
ncbi:purine nucleoside phosphorylase [Denitrobacterium detoxificans]|uniref:Purine nucleoside phosphorylase n=1 Tax=Denitrobacterium detoxificans TaxID=79604 RepID=A0A172RXR2_9ACTN|nr:purine-nucleoside phosphorylase [Denitrobacterium detoxificans]ANE22517.1 purine nucleoside phosphorylase [Denitrobacterium detoxificans]SEO99294.1 purine-nucleoside phosphorylase [Denitrobacterium detoxificans]